MILQPLLLLALLTTVSCFVSNYDHITRRKLLSQLHIGDNKGGSFISLIRDPGLSAGAGLAGLLILIVNRFVAIDTLEVSDLQSRADLISTIACSSLLLNVLSESDIVTRDRDAVALFGYALKEPMILTNSEKEKEVIKWIIQTILNNTPATSVHVIRNMKCVGRGGVIGNDDDSNSVQFNMKNMNILAKSLQNNEEIYLPDLQILPGIYFRIL